MRNFIRALIVAALPIFAAPALAGDFVPAANLKDMVLDFDTQDGNYSIWQTHDLASINAIRTTIQIHRVGMNEKWEPSFGIALGNGDEKLVFRVSQTGQQLPLEIHLLHFVGGQKVDDMPFTVTVGLDTKLDVSIDWTEAGAVTIKLGSGETRTAALKSAPTILEMSGSTGEIELNPLSLGYATP